jgi:hypothetical protein
MRRRHIVGLLTLGVLLSVAFLGAQEIYHRSRSAKAAGEWLTAFSPGPKTVMDASAVVASHAAASHVLFPDTDASLALKYIEERKVDFLVLREAWPWPSPAAYWRDWFENGIPDRRAELIYSSRNGREKLVIYKWNKNNPSSRNVPPAVPSVGSLRAMPDRSLDSPYRRVIAGLLRTNPLNPRYFADNTGKSVYLTGSHTWSNFQDSGRSEHPDIFAFERYLEFLVRHNHNFMRLWVWEQADWAPWRPYHYRIYPSSYLRTGPGRALDDKPKFDLAQFDQSYFDRLRSRAAEAGARGIYVSVMLFNGFSVERKNENWEQPWRGHPFHHDNNINGIDGDPEHHGDGRATHSLRDPVIIRYQENYVRKVIDTLNDLDNIVFEICNECDQVSRDWQYHMVSFIREYESTRAKQHMVGMTVAFPHGSNADLFASPADWISINQVGGYDRSPPPGDGSKVILADTDHIWGIGGDRHWVWQSFLRGLNPILMDPYDNVWMYPPRPPSEDPAWEDIRVNLGYTSMFAQKLDLLAIVPRGDLASSGFCLAKPTNPNATFLVYLTSGGTTTVDLSGVSGEMWVEWFDPQTGAVVSGGTVMGGAPRSFAEPFGRDAVLYIRSRT